MYNLKFKNITEVRMGSPFNIAEVELTGNYIPDFSQFTFQDIGLIDPSEDLAYLVQWDIQNNQPGFRVWRISSTKRNIYKTDRFDGCCKKLTLNDKKLEIDILQNVETVTIMIHQSDFKYN